MTPDQENGSGSRGHGNQRSDAEAPSADAARGADPLDALARALADLRFEIWRLAHAKWDLAKLGLRNRIVWWGVWVGLVTAAMVWAVAAAVLATYGLALWIAASCGDRLWLGCMAAGLIVVLGIGLGLLGLEYYFRRRALRRMESRYARPELNPSADAPEAAGTGA